MPTSCMTRSIRIEPISLDHGAVELNNQPAHSVRLIKVIDTSVPAAPPSVTASVPTHAKAGEQLRFSSVAATDQVPALSYHWDFGDGVVADGPSLTHTYTKTGTFNVRLAVDGLDGVAWQKGFSIVVRGTLRLMPPQRYTGSTVPLP